MTPPLHLRGAPHHSQSSCSLSQPEGLWQTNSRPKWPFCSWPIQLAGFSKESHLPLHASLQHVMGWHLPEGQPYPFQCCPCHHNKGKKYKVNQEGVAREDCCPLKWEEFYLLLVLVHHLYADSEVWFIWLLCSVFSGRLLADWCCDEACKEYSVVQQMPAINTVCQNELVKEYKQGKKIPQKRYCLEQ